MELQAHKSPVSETSDTLSYGSLIEDSNVAENAAKIGENAAKLSDKSAVGCENAAVESSSVPDSDRFVVVRDSKTGENRQKIDENDAKSPNVLEKFVLDSDKFALDSEKFVLDSDKFVLDSSDTDTDATRVPVQSKSSQWFQSRVAGFVAGIRGRIGSFGGNNAVSGAVKVLDGEKKKNILEEFKFSVPKDPYLSPYCADDESLRKLPPVKILVSFCCILIFTTQYSFWRDIV